MDAFLALLLVAVIALSAAGIVGAWRTRETGFTRELGTMREARDRAHERVDQLEEALDAIRGRALNVGIPSRSDRQDLAGLPLPAEVEAFIAGLEDTEARDEFRESARLLAISTPGIAGPTLLNELLG